MKRRIFLLLIFCFPVLIQPGAGQNDFCDYFPGIMERARELWNDKMFIKALDKLAAAREACPDSTAVVDKQYEAFILELAEKYQVAEEKTEEAANLTRIAIAREKEAIRERDASHNIALALQINAFDHTLALRLAEYNLMANPGNPAAIATLSMTAGPSNRYYANSLNLLGGGVLACSSDGGRIAVVSEEAGGQVWDVASKRLLFAFDYPGSSIKRLAWSPNGKYFAGTWYNSNDIGLWDAGNGMEISGFMGFPPLDVEKDLEMDALAWSPEGSRMAGGSDNGEITVWEVESRRAVFRIRDVEEEGIEALAWSPDGRRIAAISGYKSRIWDAESGLLLDTMESAYGFSSLAWSPDGKSIVLSAWGRVLTIWFVGEVSGVVDIEAHSDRIHSVVWSPDGKWIASGSEDKTVKVWERENRRLAYTLEGHHAVVDMLHWTPDGRWLVSGSEDGAVRFWDMQASQEVWSVKDEGSIASELAWSPHGKRIAGRFLDGGLRIWDAENGAELLNVPDTSLQFKGDICWSPDGGRILVEQAYNRDDWHTKVLDTKTGQEYFRFKGRLFPGSMVEMAPDGLAAFLDSEKERIGKLDTLLSSTAPYAWSPDGKWLAGSRPSLTVFDGKTLERKYSLDQESIIYSMAWSADSRVLVTRSEEYLTFWEIGNESPKDSLKTSSAWVFDLAFSPDNSLLACAVGDGDLKIYHVQTGRELLTLRHSRAVSSVCWSPDGSRVAGASEDGMVKIWQVRPYLSNIAMQFEPGDFLRVGARLRKEDLERISRPEDLEMAAAFFEQEGDPKLALAYYGKALEREITASRLEKVAGLSERQGLKFDPSSLSPTGPGDYDALAGYFEAGENWAQAFSFAKKALGMRLDGPRLERVMALAEKAGLPFDPTAYGQSDNEEVLWIVANHLAEKEQMDACEQMVLRIKNAHDTPLNRIYLFIVQSGMGRDNFEPLFMQGDLRDLRNNYYWVARINLPWEPVLDSIFSEKTMLLGERILEMDPRDTVFAQDLSYRYFFLGKDHLFSMQAHEAEQAFLRSLEIDPSSTGPRVFLPAAVLLQGRFEEAKKSYEALPAELYQLAWKTLREMGYDGVIPEERYAEVEAVKKLLEEKIR